VATELSWEPDVLPGYSAAPLQYATLVRHDGEPDLVALGLAKPKGVFLHVHGFNDYFFQTHFADEVLNNGYLFYAVDLRNVGRSLQADQIPHYVEHLREHGEDLAQAAQAVRELHPDLPLIVHAHSTGGLTASLWSHAYRNATGAKAAPDALILNSPFYEIPGRFFARMGAAITSPTLGRWRPRNGLPPGPSIYATGQHVDNGGRWEFDQNLKRTAGLPARFGWLRAVRNAQARVDRGLNIHAPILLATSARSSSGDPDLIDSTDTVLDVKSMAARADAIGKNVTLLRIDNAVHDLTLSADKPRAQYFDALFTWLDKSLVPSDSN